MKILSIDTSTQVGSVAVLDDEKVCAEISYQTKSSHAEVLISKIEEALKKANKADKTIKGIEDIDGIAVAIGPGSFTGLRIGLATAKGLAIATGRPIVGVSSLDALCHSERSEESSVLIVACINAYRGEVYTTVDSGQWTGDREEGTVDSETVMLPECSITPEALCEKLKETEGDLFFIGDGAVHYKDVFREKLGKRFHLAKGDKFPIAAQVGLLALPRFKEGKTADIITLTPNYIRRSDAELKRR